MLNPYERKLQETLMSDIYGCCTPDMTSLRYNGPILLFLYGTHQTWENISKFMKENELEYGKDWYVRENFSELSTKRFFYMFNNVSENNNMYAWIQKAVCFPTTPVTPRVCTDSWFTQSPVRGRIISLSLKALTYYDSLFDNNRSSNRIKVKLYDTKDTQHQYTAMMYQHDHNRIINVDEKTAELSFANGYKLEPYPTVTKYGDSMKRFTEFNGLNYTEASVRRVS
mgnify:CR=1 FL=1